MTSPLPAQLAKTCLENSKNFLQSGLQKFCAPKKGREDHSFDSLISKNDQRDKRQEELEEAEASKKRKKAQEAAPVSPQIPMAGDTQPGPCLELTPDSLTVPNKTTTQPTVNDVQPDQPDLSKIPGQSSNNLPKAERVEPNPAEHSEILAKTDLVTSKTPKKDGPTLATRDEPRAEENAEKSPGVYLKNNVPPENSSDAARGMKSAVRDHEMVSLATFEDAPFVAVPKTEEDPVVTSANRLSMVTSPSEKSAIPLIEGRGSGSGTASQDFSAGLPFSSPVANPEAKTAATGKASALLTSFTSEIDKFHQTGQSQIQLELPVGEKESVKIRLHLRAGEVHSTFITESPELRDALQKAWPDFTATHRIPGLRFGDSQFQDSFTQNQDATPEQGRQRFSAQDLNPAPSKPTTSRNPQTSSNLSRSPSNSGSGRMNLWA